MAIGAALCIPLLSSCDSDTDSNPTYYEAGSFVLNESAYATNNTIDLGVSGSYVSLTCDQPDYGGFPAAVLYTVQLSLDGTFVDATDSTTATYTSMSTTFTDTSIDIDADEMNSSLISLYSTVYGYDEDGNEVEEIDYPSDPIAVYVRLTAVLSVNTAYGYCESNVITLPSVLLNITEDALSAANAIVANTWYLVGGNIGDGSWGNSGVDNIGVSLYPLAETSDGILTYTGYFDAGEFKLIKTPGSWDDQWGYSDGYVKNDRGSGNISISSAGYYTVTLDYTNDILEVNAYTEDVSEYSQVYITGDFNDWAISETMTLCTGSTHLWMYSYENADYSGIKFTVDSDWSTDWGSASFPSGIGVKWGDNIPVEAGSYIVILNDIDGGYTFISK